MSDPTVCEILTLRVAKGAVFAFYNLLSLVKLLLATIFIAMPVSRSSTAAGGFFMFGVLYLMCTYFFGSESDGSDPGAATSGLAGEGYYTVGSSVTLILPLTRYYAPHASDSSTIASYRDYYNSATNATEPPMTLGLEDTAATVLGVAAAALAPSLADLVTLTLA